MHFQPIYDIAELCTKKGVNEVVLCPGSRSAPLTLAFTRHPEIKTRIFSDERSAGFIALGMAQALHKTVAVVCTSGTAAYNLAPAVAEAYFSQTSLLILTADRPAEWVAQHDGQTIFQNEIYGKHVKKFFQLPQEYEHPDNQWAINRIVNEAINLAEQEPCGPVHINAPFREPLYPEKDEVTGYSKSVRVIEEHRPSSNLSEEQKETIQTRWSSFHHVLIAGGQHEQDEKLSALIQAFAERHDIPVITDIISNLHSLETGVRHGDLFMGQATEEVKKSLRPDLLITFGQSLISKNTKNFLRQYSPAEHWHIQAHGAVADTFKHITSIFRTSASSFFDFVSTLPVDQKNFEHQKQHNYCKLWEVEERRVQRVMNSFFEDQKELTELELVCEALHALPPGSSLHLANSMSVRYANFIGLKAEQKNITVFSNRGTSGIDGCTSTSVGHCLATGKPAFLITGDVAFFYDRNAFWHNYPLQNLRVVLLNNHGGLIFNMIDGPASLPEAGEYFITRQALSAKKLCEEFQYDHLLLDNRRKLKNVLKDFFDFDGKTKILELETDVTLNRTVFDNLKQKIKKSYEL
jgi:2-succinyl-5-enolpyruvyl-6-hydroxy-3-cyclohexene-1-carboxylate synthase